MDMHCNIFVSFFSLCSTKRVHLYHFSQNLTCVRQISVNFLTKSNPSWSSQKSLHKNGKKIITRKDTWKSFVKLQSMVLLELPHCTELFIKLTRDLAKKWLWIWYKVKDVSTIDMSTQSGPGIKIQFVICLIFTSHQTTVIRLLTSYWNFNSQKKKERKKKKPVPNIGQPVKVHFRIRFENKIITGFQIRRDWF